MTPLAPARPATRSIQLRAAAVVGLLLLEIVLGELAVHLAPPDTEVAAFWPNPGISVAALAIALPRWRSAVLAGIFTVTALGNLYGGRPVDLAVSYGLLNVVEAGLVIWLLTRGGRRHPELMNLDDLIRFVLSVLAGATTGALIGAAVVSGLTDGDPVATWQTLLASHGAALLLIPPLAMRLPRHSVRPAGTLEAVLQSVLLLGVTLWVFWPDQRLPLAFLPFPLLVWGAARLRPREVTVQLLAYATLSAGMTVEGMGPFYATVQDLDLAPEMVGTLLQANAFAAALVTLPLTLVKTGRLIAIERLNRTNQMMNNIVDATTSTAILGTDPGGRIEFFNVGAENLTGQSADRIVGHAVVGVGRDDEGRQLVSLDVGRDPDRAALGALVEPFLRDNLGNVTRDWFLRRADGELRTISVALSRRYDQEGQPTGYLAVANDVTERREHERMVEEALAQEKQVTDRLAQLDETKNDFLSTVSHELRTPITSIIGYSQLLLSDDSGTLPPSHQQIVQRIERNGRRLMGLIEDMMTMSQFEMADVRFRESTFDLRAAVSNAIETVDEGLEVRKLALVRALPEQPLWVTGDVDKVERAFANVLTNAVKFSHDGDTISVELARHGGEACFCVVDTGIGISDADRVHLFDRFFRGADAREMAIQGAGLGLAITNSIVAAHNGRIEVESTLGQGTRFTIRLPLAPPATQVADTAAS